jgi:hypothetical protein
MSPLYAHFPIQCEGRTEVTYIYPQKASWHRITCYHPVEIDWNDRILRCLNPNSEGKAQIQFKDTERQIYADNLVVHYQLQKNLLNLQELKLFGHVKLIQQEIDSKTKESHVQYALADELKYDHESEKLILTAHQNKNVLYFDETHHYRMIAPEIEVKKNPETNKFNIQGQGAVRFTFQEDELEEMRQNFFKRALQNERK